MGLGVLKNHINVGFLGNTSTDPLKNHKATKPPFNIEPSSTRQRNTIKMAFQWRDGGGIWILPSEMIAIISHDEPRHKISNNVV